jgi:cytochrome P450
MSSATLAARWPFPLDDPYPELRRLREESPVHWLPEFGAHLVVSHALATEVLHGSEWSSDPSYSPRLASRLPTGGAGGGLLAKSLLFSDPPDHSRLRRALSGWLTPRAVESSRHRIAAIAGAALAGHDAGDALELMEDLAYTVPLAVICELLEAPAKLAVRLREDTPRMVALLDPLADAAALQAGAAAAFSLLVELVPLIAERRKRTGSDLLSALAKSSGDDSELEADEAIIMALLLLAAGHETTANLIGNAVAALHSHPGIARFLRRRPDQLQAAVEEFLRYDSPVQLASRVARRDTPLGETVVRRGEQVLVSLGAANRDPAAFSNPDRLDLGRQTRVHLAFGHGAHFCAGAALARVEAQEVLRRLLDLAPPIEDRELTLERDCSATFRRVNMLLLHRGHLNDTLTSKADDRSTALPTAEARAERSERMVHGHGSSAAPSCPALDLTGW